MSSVGSAEYVVCFDFGAADSVTPEQAKPARLVRNLGRHCSVDATNWAAASAVGRVLVVISDDIYPCQNWDLELKKVGQLWGDKECVVRVKTGGVADARGLLTVQILNRRRYERLGYLFHPSYESMFADDEFTLHAERDGVVVNAPHITFPHLHWSTGDRPMDDVYQRQNAPGRYERGEQNLRSRLAMNFAA